METQEAQEAQEKVEQEETKGPVKRKPKNNERVGDQNEKSNA